MVRAILAGSKTQTRRVVKDAYRKEPKPRLLPELLQKMGIGKACPYGEPGDVLWVRETFMEEGAEGRNELLRANGMKPKFIYRATDARAKGLSAMFKWKPSIFMPRWASRINLEITEVRVERLQEITEEDAIAEGIGSHMLSLEGFQREVHKPRGRCVLEYRELWDSINKKRGFGWESNPWVWAITFKVVQQ